MILPWVSIIPPPRINQSKHTAFALSSFLYWPPILRGELSGEHICFQNTSNNDCAIHIHCRFKLNWLAGPKCYGILGTDILHDLVHSIGWNISMVTSSKFKMVTIICYRFTILTSYYVSVRDQITILCKQSFISILGCKKLIGNNCIAHHLPILPYICLRQNGGMGNTAKTTGLLYLFVLMAKSF